MGYSYDIGLVVMSIVVAMTASYVALDLASRLTAAEGSAAWAWRVGGAVAMGAGIWSMHFIGMLSVQMPIPLGYDPMLTAISLLIAVITSGFALTVVSGRTLNTPALLAGGVIMGAGICGMHYTGMFAMRMVPAVRYDPLVFGASVGIAVLASMAALWLAFSLRRAAMPGAITYKLLAAGAMGLAISGMHYTGMAAAQFDPSSICTAAIRLDPNNDFLGHGIGVMVLIILWLTILALLFDARLETRTARMVRMLEREVAEKKRAQELLGESEERYRLLFDTTTDAVIVIDQNNVIDYANPAVQQMFGYAPETVIGCDIAMLQPERLQQAHRTGMKRYLESGLKTLNWRAAESFGRKQDGREFPIELAFSEITLGGKRHFAGFIRDITERRERETKIARLDRACTVRSGINSLIVRARGRQELFDGVCRIAVEGEHFRMVAIGNVFGGLVRPAAIFGFDDGYVSETLQLRTGGSGLKVADPAADARESRVHVWNDIAAEATPWRDAALRRGYRSSAAFPLLEGGLLAGYVSFYASEPGFFDEEEVELLSQLAEDVSHALDFIAQNEQLDYLAYFDPLTRLANGKLFDQRLEQFLDAARRQHQLVALLHLDLSRFKAINDSLGRTGGDQVLKQIADRLVGFTGDPSYVARVAGDRFALAITGFRTASELIQLRLELLWRALKRPIEISGQELQIAVKTGIAIFPSDGDNPDTLFRNAEAAMKLAKSVSENHLFYTPEMGAAGSERLLLESHLRRALERQEFVLHYQPKIALSSNAICGAEALLRWNSRELGLVAPMRFVPLLEETGMILEVGLWALKQASADHLQWVMNGLPAPPVSVNVSPIQLRQADFVDAVRGAIGWEPGVATSIELEITESVLMADIEQYVGKLEAVRQMGVAISIDDFGTGYSSLAYLNKLPISAVKIDRSFIVQMAGSADTLNIVSTIISLAHSLKLKVVAEGVDSLQQLQLLRQMHCDEVQGFLFSKGLPADDFALLLREDRRLAPAP